MCSFYDIEQMTHASEILPSLMLPSGKQRERERKAICNKQRNELKVFDECAMKEEMRLEASSKELAKELAYEGLRVSKSLEVFFLFSCCYIFIPFDK